MVSVKCVLFISSEVLDTGLLSPEDFSFTTGDEDQIDSNVQSHGQHQQQGHHHSHHHVESGIGSGADSVSRLLIIFMTDDQGNLYCARYWYDTS